MNRINKKAVVKIDPQQKKCMTTHQTDFKTESQYHNKNINKLVFYGSEDQHSSSQQNHDTLCQTMRETSKPFSSSPVRKYVKEPFRAETMMLRPSLMQMAHENEVDYIDFVSDLPNRLHCKENNYVSSISNSQQPKTVVQSSFITQKNDIHVVQKKQKSLIRNVPSILFFEDSQDEIQSLKAQKTQEQPIQDGNTHNIDSKIDDQEASNQTNRQKAGNFFQNLSEKQFEQENKSIQTFNILQINEEVNNRSSYFEKIVKNSTDDTSITKLMFTPLRMNTKQIFQVIVTNTIMQKSFELWIDSLPTMRLLMKAKKNIKLHKTSYEILTYLQDCQQYCQTCSIVSNIERSQFNIEIQRNNSKDVQISGTITSSITLQSTKNLVLYYPMIDPQTETSLHIAKDEKYSNLKQIYQLKDPNSVNYIITTKLPIEDKLRLFRDYKFKVSDKSMEFRNKEGELKLIIGKKESKRYTLIAGSNLTPIQLFSLAIVNIETN